MRSAVTVGNSSRHVHAYNTDLTGWHPNNATPFDDFLNVDI
jgi:hypothetical protein